MSPVSHKNNFQIGFIARGTSAATYMLMGPTSDLLDCTAMIEWSLSSPTKPSNSTSYAIYPITLPDNSPGPSSLSHFGLSLLQTTYLRSNYRPSRQIQSLWKGSETAIVQRSPKESGTEFRLFKYQRLSRCRCRRRCQGLFFCSKLELGWRWRLF